MKEEAWVTIASESFIFTKKKTKSEPTPPLWLIVQCSYSPVLLFNKHFVEFATTGFISSKEVLGLVSFPLSGTVKQVRGFSECTLMRSLTLSSAWGNGQCCVKKCHIYINAKLSFWKVIKVLLQFVAQERKHDKMTFCKNTKRRGKRNMCVSLKCTNLVPQLPHKPILKSLCTFWTGSKQQGMFFKRQPTSQPRIRLSN